MRIKELSYLTSPSAATTTDGFWQLFVILRC